MIYFLCYEAMKNEIRISICLYHVDWLLSFPYSSLVYRHTLKTEFQLDYIMSYNLWSYVRLPTFVHFTRNSLPFYSKPNSLIVYGINFTYIYTPITSLNFIHLYIFNTKLTTYPLINSLMHSSFYWYLLCIRHFCIYF